MFALLRLSFSRNALLPLAFAVALNVSGEERASAQTNPSPSVHGSSQATPESVLDELSGVVALASANDAGPPGIIPVQRGFNASIGSTSQHDSTIGWLSLLTPNAAYRFNRYFSVDAGAPIYMYLNTYINSGTDAKPDYHYVIQGGLFGDTSVSFHLDTLSRLVNYSATVSMGLPSGSTEVGLGAGQPTYDVNNHFEKTFGIFTPEIEVGQGDASSLVDQRILKSYISVGPMAHFQAGTYVDLPFNLGFESEAYELLPLDTNLIYSTSGKGKKKVTTSTNIDPAEDNGFLTSLDIPVSPHVTLSGFYDHSLRDHEDVAGFSLTWLLRPPPKPAEP